MSRITSLRSIFIAAGVEPCNLGRISDYIQNYRSKIGSMRGEETPGAHAILENAAIGRCKKLVQFVSQQKNTQGVLEVGSSQHIKSPSLRQKAMTVDATLPEGNEGEGRRYTAQDFVMGARCLNGNA